MTRGVFLVAIMFVRPMLLPSALRLSQFSQSYSTKRFFSQKQYTAASIDTKHGEEEAMRTTRSWIDEFVVKLKLCPFADAAMKNSVSMRCYNGTSESELVKIVEEELLKMAEWKETEKASGATAFVIAADMFPDFLSYMHFANERIDSLLAEHDLHGTLQVAHFHPAFQFHGNDPCDPHNKVNRSPFPMFHILREEEVTRASDLMDTESIWRRNEKLMRRLLRSPTQHVK